MEHAVVPDFVLRLQWLYVGTWTQTTFVSHTGIRTTAKTCADMPRPMDRIPLLFLCSKALEGSEARFNVREIADLYGVPWKRDELLERLDRVLSCQIDLPTQDGWRRLRITKRRDLDWETGDVHLVFGRELGPLVENGTYYSIDIARRLARKVAALELYFLLLAFIQRGHYRERWDPYDELRAARRRSKIGQQLRQRLALITKAWPEHPFRLIPRTRFLTCTYRAFKEHVFNRNEDEEERLMDIEIDTRNRAEFRDYLDTLPFYRRERLMNRYLERCMLPLDDEACLLTRSRRVNADVRRVIQPRQPDARVPGDALPTQGSDSEPTAKGAKVQQTAPAPEAPATPSPAMADKQPDPTGTADSASTIRPDNPAQAEPAQPANLLGRTRARIQRVRAQASYRAGRWIGKQAASLMATWNQHQDQRTVLGRVKGALAALARGPGDLRPKRRTS